MEDNKNKAALEIELKDEVAGGIYANMAVTAHSRSEFVLDFISLLPGMNKAQVRSRVIMTPEHAKRLLAALQDNVNRYESLFGEIELEQVMPMPNIKNVTPRGDA